MPFTPTHVLAVLPIAAVRRLGLPLSALAIGSMVPDLPLFAPVGVGYGQTHSALGVVTACWPLGLTGFLVFQGVLKRPLYALLPDAIRRRCVPFARSCIEPTAAFLARASLAVMAGAVTHVVWDSFTHRGRWGSQHVPALNETALVLGGYDVPGTKVFQYGSTFVGLPVLALLLAAWLARRPVEPPGVGLAIPTAGKCLAFLVAVAIPTAVTLLVRHHGHLSTYEQLGRSITTSGLVLFLTTLAYCVGYHAAERWFVPTDPRLTR